MLVAIAEWLSLDPARRDGHDVPSIWERGLPGFDPVWGVKSLLLLSPRSPDRAADPRWCLCGDCGDGRENN